MDYSGNRADPILTANIYASGILDELLQEAVGPFRDDLKRIYPDESCYLWIMRYGRGGDHLKIRLHGESGEKESLRALLAEHVEKWLRSVRALPTTDARTDKPKSPPIDVEDEAEIPFPDRTLVWTSYRRRHISLPAAPWLTDDILVAFACRCLAASTDLVLTAWSEQEIPSTGKRQALLAKNVLSAMGTIGRGAPAKALEYLQHHRDWLLRFFIASSSKEQDLRNRFDEQVRRNHNALIALQEQADRTWSQPADREDEPWLCSLSALALYANKFKGRKEYRIDPYTTEIDFSPIFKMLHGFANQLGLPPLHEAYAYHMLMAALQDRLAAAAPSELLPLGTNA